MGATDGTITADITNIIMGRRTRTTDRTTGHMIREGTASHTRTSGQTRDGITEWNIKFKKMENAAVAVAVEETTDAPSRTTTTFSSNNRTMERTTPFKLRTIFFTFSPFSYFHYSLILSYSLLWLLPIFLLPTFSSYFNSFFSSSR